MGFASAKTYDIEVWLPSQKTLSRDLLLQQHGGVPGAAGEHQVPAGGTGKAEFVHTLNGSGPRRRPHADRDPRELSAEGRHGHCARKRCGRTCTARTPSTAADARWCNPTWAGHQEGLHSVMNTTHLTRGVLAAALVCFSAHAHAAVQLTTVVSGLSSPIFVGHAGDDSNRLFIVEQGGRIKVLQPDETVPTVFLDISAKTVASGERGLLGLAFHPDYSNQWPLFRFLHARGRRYAGDRRVSGVFVQSKCRKLDRNRAADDCASPLEPQRGNARVWFDGYLYIGVGDGGGANDPNDNAQNVNVLLGKILQDQCEPCRITVIRHHRPTHSSARQLAATRSSPSDSATPGASASTASPVSNGSRTSDKGRGRKWTLRLVNGGNYGWRVFEGNFCTGLGPAPCIASNYEPPVFDYDTHAAGRCSVTGGYVYKGSLGTLPTGTYVYGDYCSGEILAGTGATHSLAGGHARRTSPHSARTNKESCTSWRLAARSARSYRPRPARSRSRQHGRRSRPEAETKPWPLPHRSGCAWTAASNVHVDHDHPRGQRRRQRDGAPTPLLRTPANPRTVTGR